MKKKKIPRIGVLGGGQLARYLAVEGEKDGFEVHILSEHPTDPAARVAKNWQKGVPTTEKAIRHFAKNLDFLTFESEFIDANVLKKISKQNKNLKLFPRPEVLSQIQDRREQKKLLNIFDLPTAFWISFNQNVKSQNAETLLWEIFPNGFVLKQRRNGYDGYGTFIFKNKKSWQKNKPKNLEGFIAEELIPFKKELALMVGRTKNGKFFRFPLVETSQKNAQCDWVLGPTEHPQINDLVKSLNLFLKEINYVGILGIELFLTAKNNLIINELAPRVHNSAHYSLSASNVNQFVAHLRAGTGKSIPAVKSKTKYFTMVNLLGQSNVKPVLPKSHKGDLYWYGKSENRPRRKMGHLNLNGNSKSILKAALKERGKFKI